jgi:hypothetical protein
VSEIVSTVRKNKQKSTPWRLPLEIFNTVFVLAAFVAATIYAADLELYCVPMDVVWVPAKLVLQDLVPTLSILVNICPLSKAGAAFTGFAT